MTEVDHRGSPSAAVAEMRGHVRITEVDLFAIDLPLSRAYDGLGYGPIGHNVAVVDTDAGVTGYSFAGPSTDWLQASFSDALERHIRPALVGHDLFDVNGALRRGLGAWYGLEHAIWDAIGRVAGLPVYKMLGGGPDRLRAYLTCVWPGAKDQSHVGFDEQAAMAVAIKDAGFGAMKFRAWRPDPLDDARACGVIREAVGDDFVIMIDRTASQPGWVWDFDTALAVARALEEHNVYWLEEPFDKDDFVSPARLAAEVDIPITGGEQFRGPSPFASCLENGSFDILQPDVGNAGGILTTLRAAAMAQGFGVRCVPHGAGGLKLAGWLHAGAAMGAEWQELGWITPPLMPTEQWTTALEVLTTDTLYTYEDGHIVLPKGPGLGLDVDRDALERLRVRT